METVIVKNISYFDFIREYDKITIPDYQRPYRWSQEKVNELLQDLKEFFIEKPKVSLDYYIGTILLYDNKSKGLFEVIDGQQRLTTLNLIYYILNGEIVAGQDFSYNNHLSFNHIKDNINYLKNCKEQLKALEEKDIFKKLVFTLIISNNEDHSFAFFDSQNNRGVSLEADDYLKAYHLREVGSEKLQSKLAEEWEAAAIKAQSEQNVEKGLLHLFYKILYRAREWKGQTQIIPEGKEQILSSFQKKTRKNEGNGYKLFVGRDNIRFSEVKLSSNDDILLQDAIDKNITSTSLPFSLRQPLYKGLNFFQFTQKYYAIHQLLFHQPELKNSAIASVRDFYGKVYNNNMSEYLRHYMQLCLVVYYDSFGSIEIDKAIQYFDYFMGSIRVEKIYVRQEAIKNSLIYASNNLLDVIASAYLPEEVFDFIKSQQHIQDVYEKENLDKEDAGARNSYKKRIMTYYGKKETRLKNRIQWIV
jgi:MoaA/NifB/PqqE/SkfB family radical SAM enzyme